MKFLKFILSYVFIFSMLSCTDEIPVKDIFEPQVFVSGSISNKEKKVRVSLIKTANLNKQSFYESIPERNASIEFWSKDASGNKTMITDDFKSEEGHYESSENISLTEDSQYWIEIELANGDKLESSPEALLKPVKVTDITFSALNTRVHFEDPPNETNFYLISYTFYEAQGIQSSTFEVINDQLFDGNKKAFHEIDNIYGDRVTVEVSNINYGTYSFYLNYEAQNDQKVEEGETGPFTIFLPPPSNLTGNLWYKDEDRMALGYFGVLSASSMNKWLPNTGEPIDMPYSIRTAGYFNGPDRADIVILNCQGGPFTELQNDQFNEWLGDIDTEDVLKINVHQTQTLNPLIDGFDMTLQDYYEGINTNSVYTLYELTRYFKKVGREVYILGSSFGAFIVQELIAEKGLHADGYLLMAGRLDMNEEVWKGLAEGKNGHFEGGITPVLVDQDQVIDRNLSRLKAALVKYRFTDKLDIYEDLSKVTYVYGEQDEAVGRLTDAEIAFLKAKNVNVIKGTGNHQAIKEDFVAQGFKEAFGIE